MNIQVCIGSACHKRGSYDIMKRVKALVQEHGLEDSVQVSPAFCLGQCKNGISVKVGDELFLGVSMDNIDEIFASRVLG